jgi:hypothetical protein
MRIEPPLGLLLSVRIRDNEECFQPSRVFDIPMETQRHKGHKGTKKTGHPVAVDARISLCLCALCVSVFLAKSAGLRNFDN